MIFPTYLYADDTSTVIAGVNMLQIQEIYMKICKWFGYNGLYLNKTKTQLLYYALLLGYSTYTEPVIINSSLSLQRRDTAKFLGLYIDSKLNWKIHIEDLLARLQKQTWKLSNLVKILSKYW